MANTSDIIMQSKQLKEYEKYLNDAKELKKKIQAEIDKLRNKFKELSTKHFS